MAGVRAEDFTLDGPVVIRQGVQTVSLDDLRAYAVRSLTKGLTCIAHHAVIRAGRFGVVGVNHPTVAFGSRRRVGLVVDGSKESAVRAGFAREVELALFLKKVKHVEHGSVAVGRGYLEHDERIAGVLNLGLGIATTAERCRNERYCKQNKK